MKKTDSPYHRAPLYLTKSHGYFHICGSTDGGRIRVTTNTNILEEAERKLYDLHHEIISGFRPSDVDPNTEWSAVAKSVWSRHRFHAKARGIPFEISTTDVYRLMREAGFRCAVSGIPLSRRGTVNGEPDPWGPSIDRIENRHGYLKDNIRIVSLAANLAMNRWGYDVLLRLSRAVARAAVTPAAEILAHSSHIEIEKSTQVDDFAGEIESRKVLR